MDLIRRALAEKPDNGYYADSLGWAYFQKGMLEEALAELKRASELVREDPVIREHLGDVYLRKGMREEARGEWIRSLGLDPKNEKLRNKFREAGFGDPPPRRPMEAAPPGREARSFFRSTRWFSGNTLLSQDGTRPGSVFPQSLRRAMGRRENIPDSR